MDNCFVTPIALSFIVLLSSCSLFGDGKDEPSLPGRIVFSSQQSGEYQIYSIRPDGSGLRQLTDFEQDGAYEPAWSPDGSQIAFVTPMQSTTLGLSIYLMDADGDNIRPLKRYEGGPPPRVLFGSEPTWSPDGRRIAYSMCTNCELGGLNYELFIEEVEGELYDPKRSVRLTDHPASDLHPAWSPDGQRIAFLSNRDYFTEDSARYRSDIYVTNTDGENAERITEIGATSGFAWLSNTSIIVGARNELFVLDLKTRETRPFEIDFAESIIRVLDHPMNSAWLLLGARSGEDEYIIRTVDLNGRTLSSFKLPLDDASSFDWILN